MAEKKASALNPFHIQGMIRDLKFFFGRKSELAAIWGYLRKNENVSIVGKRRFGKSSLLWYIKEKALDELKDVPDPGPVVFYINMETIRDEDEFFDRLAKELKANDVTARELERKLEEIRVILCLDEFDRTAKNDNFSDDFFGILRGLSQGPNLTLVVATKIPLIEYVEEGMTSPLFNIFPPTPITLGPLTKEEARQLLTGIAAFEKKEFSAQELDQALEIVKDYYPWNVQYIGWCWFKSEFSMEKAERMYRESLENKSDGRLPTQPPDTVPDIVSIPPSKKRKDWIPNTAALLTVIFVLLMLYTIMTRDTGMVLIDIGLAAVTTGLYVLHLFKSRGKKT